MKLSICMMVKNEEKNLHRCLKSLGKLREAVSSELIIVDTGSTDDTVDIAKEYTDKVYFHKWNNNFSEMRNVSISYAKGDWIMIIDADEEVQDATLLIKFFDNNLEKKLNTLFLFVKNYAFEGNDYKSGIVKSPRLFRNDGTFKYEGRVHNQPVFKNPIGQLDTTLMHYGYIIDDKETMERKFIRTRDLLLGELKNDPENVYYLFQLGVTYGMHYEYDKALEKVKRAYDIVKDRNLKLKDYIYVFNQLIEFYMANGKYREAEEIAEETITIDKDNLDAYFNLGKIKLNFEKYEAGRAAYNKYLKIKEKLMETTDINNTYYTVTRSSEVYFDMAKLNYKKALYDECINNIMNIDTMEIIEENYKFLVECFLKSEEICKFVEFYNGKINDSKDILKDAVIIKLEEGLNSLDNFKKMEAFKELKNINNENYSLLSEIRLDYLKNKLDQYKVKEALKKINFNDAFEFYGDIIYYAFLLNFSMENVLLDITEKNIDAFLGYVKNKYSNFTNVLTNYLSSYISSEQYESIRLVKNISRYVMLWNQMDDKEFMKVFNAYVENGVKFINTLYSDFIIQNELIYDLKNSEEIFFLFMMKAFNFLENDKSKAISYLRKALQEAPIAKRGIELILKDIENQVGSGVSEFEQYKLQVKGTIKSLIASGDTESAKSIIEEYEKIVKDDVEIVLIKSEIALSELKGKAEVNSKVRM